MEKDNSGLLAEIRKRVELKKRQHTEISALSEEEQVTASTSQEEAVPADSSRRVISGMAETISVNNMAAPSNTSDGAVFTQFSEHLKEFINQGPVFLKLQESFTAR